MRAFNLTVFVLLVGLMAGCDAVGRFENAASATVDGLDLHLLAPDTVAVSDSFKVRFVVQNHTNQEVAITTPGACLIDRSIVENGTVVPFKGSRSVCAAVVTTHKIPSGEMLERMYDVQAVLYTSEGEKPVSPGRYTIRAELPWTIEGEKVDLSVIGRELVVRP